MKISPTFSKGQWLRFFTITIFLSAAAGFLLVKYAHIMLGPRYTAMNNEARLAGDRGFILDRTGRLLAIQTRFGHISVWKPDLDPSHATEMYAALGRILDLDPLEIARRIENEPKNFLYLARHVENSVVQQIEAEIAAGTMPGINVETILGRVYPEENLAASIIGIVGDENRGLEGIEFIYDKELSARFENGEAVSGDQVILTIDANIQYILEEIAGRVLTENEAEAVMLIAMDPRSGDILGSASMPGFNPNIFRETTREERRHRPAEFTYEPGSVFKIFSLALMLDDGSITPASSFYCNGSYEHVTNLGERIVINCLGAHHNVTAREIIIHSCNAGIAYASDREAVLPFYNGIRTLGFGVKTGAELPGETSGFIRLPERWSDRSKPTIAMGQEIAVSALQMMEGATAIANDGILVRPHFVRQILSADGKTVRYEPNAEPRRVIKAETARQMRSYMQAVTSSIGTGWRANVADLNLAVKTGTGQVTDSANNRYSETDYIASCIAILPAENPTLVLYLVIIKPKGEYLAGRIAAPPIREAAEALVNYLGIPRGKNPQIRHTGEIIIEPQTAPVVNGIMPNLTGTAKRDLVPLLLDENLNIEVRGDGWVKRQYPPPGAQVNNDTVIILELE
ncbi:MAG: PASTA domain-containing protein [Spirochaetaceae bacterium]|jgi:cell division protein FtsI (penicillin-binding protein 3)|nr:PASTA domain-containing protein [Spirochaetaceae bacterium]